MILQQAAPRNALGAALLALSWVFFTTEMVAARILASDGMSTFQIAVFRTGTQALAFLPFILWTRGALLHTARFPMHLLRSALGAGGMILFYLSFALLPLAVATTLTFMQAGFVTVLAALLLRERIGPRRIAAVIVGFFGVLVVMRPGFGGFDPAMLFALMAAMVAAGLMILTRSLSATDARFTVMAWSGWLGLAYVCVPAAILWQPIAPGHWPLLAMVGAAGTVGQFLMVGAFTIAEASSLAPVDYIRLIFAVLAGYVLFSEVPDLWTWIGSAIIIGSVLYTTFRERQLARSTAPTARRTERSSP